MLNDWDQSLIVSGSVLLVLSINQSKVTLFTEFTDQLMYSFNRKIAYLFLISAVEYAAHESLPY